jgi:hypothetical protein
VQRFAVSIYPSEEFEDITVLKESVPRALFGTKNTRMLNELLHPSGAPCRKHGGDVCPATSADLTLHGKRKALYTAAFEQHVRELFRKAAELSAKYEYAEQEVAALDARISDLEKCAEGGSKIMSEWVV